MKDKDASELDELLGAFAHADRLAREAALHRQEARIAIVQWVERFSVPAGTPDGALDIPAFLRENPPHGSPPHGAGIAPLRGCNCEHCNDARSRARLSE